MFLPSTLDFKHNYYVTVFYTLQTRSIENLLDNILLYFMANSENLGTSWRVKLLKPHITLVWIIQHKSSYRLKTSSSSTFSYFSNYDTLNKTPRYQINFDNCMHYCHIFKVDSSNEKWWRGNLLRCSGQEAVIDILYPSIIVNIDKAIFSRTCFCLVGAQGDQCGNNRLNHYSFTFSITDKSNAVAVRTNVLTTTY